MGIVKDFLNELGLPEYIVAAVLLLNLLFVSWKPITAISSNILERKLYTKEKLFILKSYFHFWNSVFWMVLFLSGAIIINLPEWITSNGNVITFLVLIFGELILLFIIALNEKDNEEDNEKDNKKDNKKENSESEVNEHANDKIKAIQTLVHRSFKFFKGNLKRRLLLTIIFMLCLIIFYDSSNLYLINSSSDLKGLSRVIFILIASFLIALPTPFFLRPISKFIGWTKEENVYLMHDDTKWYVLYPINKELILLGNNSNPKRCDKTKILKLEDFHNKTLFLEKKNK
ncbi:hypothetical protein [Bacillus subtilis]|uniref:hypothetical protein n=1 Tax=Bacillus subtilis TaxID=1423 RepID=UPI000F5432DD|nr:hypothetical protein [Bacillus subtilis]RPK11627.1 hypothetical protein EH5_01792 [Bacillus subtilis]